MSPLLVGIPCPQFLIASPGRPVHARASLRSRRHCIRAQGMHTGRPQLGYPAGRLQPLAACHHRVPFLKAFFPSASVPCGVAVAPPRNDRPHRGFFTVASHQRRPLMGPDRRRSQATRVRSESHICQVLSEIIVRRDEYTIIVYTTAFLCKYTFSLPWLAPYWATQRLNHCQYCCNLEFLAISCALSITTVPHAIMQQQGWFSIIYISHQQVHALHRSIDLVYP